MRCSVRARRGEALTARSSRVVARSSRRLIDSGMPPAQAELATSPSSTQRAVAHGAIVVVVIVVPGALVVVVVEPSVVNVAVTA